MDSEESGAIDKGLSSRDSLRRRLVKGDKKKFQKYVDSTTTHGVKRIFNGKSYIRRGFWGLLFIGMVIGCLYGIVHSIREYARIPVSTTVYTDHVEKLTFPAVTICNINGYNGTYLEENNLTDIVTEAVFQRKAGEETLENLECAAQVPPSYPIDTTTLFETVAEASQSLESLVQTCHFLGEPCNNSEMFIDYYTPSGNCFTFNGRNSERKYMSVHGGGFRHDLELVLNVEQDVFIGSVTGEAGALVSIHEQDTPAQVWESGVFIPVGHSAYLAVTKEHIEDRTDRPGGDELECIHISEAPEFEVFTSYNYSFRSCRGECIVQHLVTNCNCLWTGKNLTDSNYTHCDISNICCVYNVLQSTSNCSCRVLCNHTAYEVVPSYSTYPSQKAAKTLAKNFSVSEERLRTDFLKVHVFFKSLSISREITERSYSLTELIANIGGNMGLFLGASIISFTEFLTLIFDLIKDRFFGIRERKIRSSLSHFRKKFHPDKPCERDITASNGSENSSDSGFPNAAYQDYEDSNQNLVNGTSEE